MKQFVMGAAHSGTRKNRAVDHLLLHSEVLRSCQNEGFVKILDPSNIVGFQRRVVSAAQKRKGVGRWMATVPIKVIVVSKSYPIDIVNQLEVPLGKNIVEGIRRVIGININEGRKRDVEIAQEIHKHLAVLANTDIFTINSGFWEIGR